MASARIRRRSAVIWSPSISFRPNPNRCGASRLSGRVTTSPPKPALPRGRPWQPAQLSIRPAPMIRSTMGLPAPSPVSGPWPCSRVNLRWKICRPRRIARAGSRLMMKREEFGRLTSPLPTPICSRNVLAIPRLAAFGASVRSMSCPMTGLLRRAPTKSTVASAKTDRKRILPPDVLDCDVVEGSRLSYERLQEARQPLNGRILVWTCIVDERQSVTDVRKMSVQVIRKSRVAAAHRRT